MNHSLDIKCVVKMWTGEQFIIRNIKIKEKENLAFIGDFSNMRYLEVYVFHLHPITHRERVFAFFDMNLFQ